MEIQKGKSLKELTTFKIGGPAEFFVEVENTKELLEAFDWANQKKITYFVLGGGSNILVSDEGFPGLVIKINIKGINFNPDGTVTANAGEKWDDLVSESVKRNLWGVENLSYIPGSVGAAPVQNIGAYGQELSDTFLWTEVFDVKRNKVVKFKKEGCCFGYRDSVFKQNPGRHIILRIALKLKTTTSPNLKYKDLTDFFEGRKEFPSGHDIRGALWRIRSDKGMVVSKNHPKSAGSFFKNPVVSKEFCKNLEKKFPNMPSYQAFENLVKLPAAWIIDKICDLRGYRKGDVGISEKQAVSIVNYGNATAKDVHDLAEFTASKVKQKTGIDIEWEVTRV